MHANQTRSVGRLLSTTALLILFVATSVMITGCGDGESVSVAPGSSETLGQDDGPEIYCGGGAKPNNGGGNGRGGGQDGEDPVQAEPQGKPIIEF